MKGTLGGRIRRSKVGETQENDYYHTTRWQLGTNCELNLREYKWHATLLRLTDEQQSNHALQSVFYIKNLFICCIHISRQIVNKACSEFVCNCLKTWRSTGKHSNFIQHMTHHTYSCMAVEFWLVCYFKNTERCHIWLRYKFIFFGPWICLSFPEKVTDYYYQVNVTIL